MEEELEEELDDVNEASRQRSKSYSLKLLSFPIDYTVAAVKFSWSYNMFTNPKVEYRDPFHVEYVHNLFKDLVSKQLITSL